MELPHWTDIVKTARFKELAPYDPDWYYIRAASMARKIYLRHGIGVGGFQKIYGGRRRNGSCPPHFCKSSGAVARHILQQLKSMDIIDIDPKGGRMLTSQGRRDLDQVAGRVSSCSMNFLF
ncbi:40S ribosomal protein S19 [Rhynchospora pubera]|uniref:40S ribosomal protein S19 n=1 Tax=Rhynchospora pubera TaxID=906938 RepID=A0AAV8DMT2_9POAL|nr:40S ribosomal protein S19 [Rhynchospora pubera]